MVGLFQFKVLIHCPSRTLRPDRMARVVRISPRRDAMSKRATDVIGKPLMSAASGEKMGTVTDLLLDESNVALIGLVVSRGMLKGEHVLPISAVQTFGTDAVVSRSSELVNAKQWRQQRSQHDALVLQDEDEIADPLP
jgi:sporulation protein YlmC with PRC-barrel domain